MLLAWVVLFMNVLCLSKHNATITIKTTDVTDKHVKKDNKSAKVQDVHLHLTSKKDANISAHTSSKTDADSIATVHIHIIPPVLDYYSKKCSIHSDTLLNLCSNEIQALNKSLQIVTKLISSFSTNQSLNNHLKKYENIVCPSSIEWISFTGCYCTKCESELSNRNIPNQNIWYNIWNNIYFCDLHADGVNWCQSIKRSVSKRSRHMNIDSMFKTAWNSEVNIAKKTKSQQVTDLDEIDEIDTVEEIDEIDEIDEKGYDKEYLLTSVSSMLETNLLIYIWTFLFASCITLFSFFMFYR